MTRGTLPGFPLTAAQAGIWFAAQVDPASPVYGIGWFVDVRGGADVARLGAAIGRALTEAACLHVTAGTENGVPVQYPAPFSGEVPVVDLRAEADPERAAHERMRATLGLVPDLGHGPLTRHELLVLGPDRVLWFQGFHHLVMDAYGQAVLTSRAAELYSGE